MSTITITAADVAYSESGSENSRRHTKPAATALTAGQYVKMNTTGKLGLGNATDAAHVGYIARGIVIASVGADETATVVSHGIVDLGSALDGMTINDPVYLGDSDGVLQTTAGTVSTAIVGYVYGIWTDTTVKKVLYVILQ